MESSDQVAHPHISNQRSNPLQFTIHLPLSNSISSINPDAVLNPSSSSNAGLDHFLSVAIPKGKRRGRPRRPSSCMKQVINFSLLSTSNSANGSAVQVSSLGSSSGQINKVQTENCASSVAKKYSAGSNFSNVGKKVVNDVSEEIIVINKDAMSEALVALSAGFPADSLTDEEIDAGVVSVVGGIEQVNYILIRNHIMAKWRANVSTWFTKDMFLGIIPQHCGVLLNSAYNYLILHGYINFGIAPGVKEKILTEPSKPHVIVIGAGLAGLAAARQMMAFGFKVTVLEGRKRAGGRVYTTKLVVGNRSAVADLGGSVLTGTLGNPLGILARQMSFTLHKVRDKCPLYRVDGKPVDPDLDQKVETAFNRLLDKISKLRQMMGEVSQDVSLGAALETFWEVQGDEVNEEEMNLFHWHLANLEYANAGLLSKLSLAFWDQDDPYDMGGDHCFLPGGNGRLVQALAENVPIIFEKTVQAVRYGSDGVQVVAGGQVYDGDMTLCTVPLGVLKSGSIKFVPELPQRKLEGIKRLGFGLLNKVAMLFPQAFWGTDLDTFGHLSDNPSLRGEFFLFYSYATVAGGPILIALVAGEAAYRFETMEPIESVTRVLQILKGIYEPQGIEVPEPIQTVCTRWGGDPFCLGSYSNVAVGASGDDYDILAESVGDGRLFFAGEATTRRYPATMHGALLSGFREAANMAHYARVRASGLKVEKSPSRNAHSCASILADLFREPDLEFGSFSIIFGRKHTESMAILKVTFGGQLKKPDHQHSNKLLFEQLQSHFNQLQEFPVYTLLSKKQALELREVRGGDGNRLSYLIEKFGVKLLGRKGLGPVADSIIASVKAERSSRKPSSSGKSNTVATSVKQKLVRKAKIVRNRKPSVPSPSIYPKAVTADARVEFRSLVDSNGSFQTSADIGMRGSNGHSDPAPCSTDMVTEFASDVSSSVPQYLVDNNASTTDLNSNIESTTMRSNYCLDLPNSSTELVFSGNTSSSNPQNPDHDRCLMPSSYNTTTRSPIIQSNPNPPNLNIIAEAMDDTCGSNIQNTGSSNSLTDPPSLETETVAPADNTSPETAPSISQITMFNSLNCTGDVSDSISSLSVQENIFEDIMNELLPPSGIHSDTWHITGKF